MQIQNGFKETFFCWRSYLNSDDIFSWFEIGSGFGESAAHPHHEFAGVPPWALTEAPSFAVLFLNSIGDNVLSLIKKPESTCFDQRCYSVLESAISVLVLNSNQI